MPADQTVMLYRYANRVPLQYQQGGCAITKAVIGTDWRPIPGLYTCGEMVGGLFHDNYGAGSGLVSGATFGRIAGRSAAQIEM